MNMHSRPQDRWDGTNIHPDDLRDAEAGLNWLLHQARARSAAARATQHSPRRDWPIAADSFQWRPEGQTEGRRSSEKPHWAMRALAWLLLLAMPGVVGVLFASDLATLIDLVL
jgi:hypothetical protein